jgi:hypothetical protein
LNVVIAFPSAFANTHGLAKAIKRAIPALRSVIIEDSCLVCESTDAVEHASRMTKLFGIERVAIAKKVSSRFSDLCAEIAKVGSKIVMPGHSFYIRTIIQQSARHDYVSRDVEFAASGMLTARLAAIKAHPAKSEKDAQDFILVVVGQKWAYVCIQMSNAPGGIVAGSQGSVLASIHGPLSLLSCLNAAKGGFELVILLPYFDEEDLKRNTALAQVFVTKTGTRKQKILATPINVREKGTIALFLREMIISEILNSHSNYNRIVLPLNIAVHPLWMIDLVIREAVSAKKTPFAPLLFMSEELISYAQVVGIQEQEILSETIQAKEDFFRKYSRIIESEAKVAIKRTKRLDLEVGPNYLHDVIDSI